MQKYILSDDSGWFRKSITNYSYWGWSSKNGDCYSTGDKKDLMNEGSSSRIYSFNIYLTEDIILYHRTYKKMFLIIADRLPIVNIVYMFFSFLAKIFKISSGNKKLTELLFENLKEKPNQISKIDHEPFNVLKIKPKSVKKFSSIKKNFSNNNLPLQNGNSNANMLSKNNNLGNSTNNNILDVSSYYLHLSPQNNSKQNFFFETRKRSVEQKPKNKFSKKLKIEKNNLSNILSNNSYRNHINLNYYPKGLHNNNISININNNVGNSEMNKSEGITPKHQSSKLNIKKKTNNEGIILTPKNKRIINIKSKTKYIKMKLFPYKYYLCSIFIKNVGNYKKSIFFTKKFINVYNFICQLFDISSYLILQREFQIIKNALVRGKYREIIEKRQKINVNDHSFYTDIKECLDYQRFSILARV